ALLAIGIAMHMVNATLSLRGLTQWTFTARMLAVGHCGLALTTLFGLSLATNHIWPFLPGALFPALHAHVQLALLAWVAPMIFGVAARIFPMFLLAPEPRGFTARLQLWGLAGGTPLIVLGLLVSPTLLFVGALTAATAAGSHAAMVIEMVC